MSKFLAIAMLSMCSLTLIGCHNKDGHRTNGSPQMMSADGCNHCPGNQTLKADGTCPGCGMKMTKS